VSTARKGIDASRKERSVKQGRAPPEKTTGIEMFIVHTRGGLKDAWGTGKDRTSRKGSSPETVKEKERGEKQILDLEQEAPYPAAMSMMGKWW